MTRAQQGMSAGRLTPLLAVLVLVLLALAPVRAAPSTCNVDGFALSPELLGKAVGREASWCIVDASAVSEPQSECVMYTQLINAALRDAGMACPQRAAAYLAIVSRYTFAMSDVEGLPPPRGWVRTTCRGNPQLGISEQLAAFPYPDDCDAGPDACACGDDQDELSVGARPRNNFGIWAWALSEGAPYLLPDACHDMLAAADVGEGEAGSVSGKGGGASGADDGPWNPDTDGTGMTWKQREAVWRAAMKEAKKVAKEAGRKLAPSASTTGVHLMASCVGFADTDDVADAYNMALYFLTNGDNFDTVSPTGSLECRNCVAGIPTRADPLTFLASFDEPVVMLAGAVTVSSGAVAALGPAPGSDNAVWYFEVHGAVDGELAVAVALVVDAALNAGPANAPLEFRVIVDHAGPTAVLSAPSLPVHNGMPTTNARAVPFTVAFSEAAVLHASDVRVSSGSVHSVTTDAGDSSRFTFVVADPVPDGTLSVTVTQGADVAGNVLASSSNTVTVVMDSEAPTVVSFTAEAVAGTDADGTPQVHAAVAFSERVMLSPAKVVASSGTVASVTPVGGAGADGAAAAFIIVVTGADHGVLMVSVVAATDPAGNELAAPSSVELVVDMLGPSAYLAVNLPAASLVGGTTAATTVPFTLTLSEPGRLASADISATGGTVSALTPVPAGAALATTWSFRVEGAPDGPLVVGVVRVVDGTGNVGPFNAPVAEVVVVDTVGPSGIVHSPESGKVASAAPSPAFTCQFDEPAVLAAADIAVSSGTVSKLTPLGDGAASGVAKTWGWVVTGAEDGPLTVGVGAGTDAVGNPLREPVAPRTINLLRSPPRVVSVTSSAVTAAGTSADPLVVTATFSRAVVLSKDGITTSSGRVSKVRPAGEASYTFEVAGLEQGPLHVSVVSATDAAGNQLVLEGLGEAAATHVLITVVDTVGPTVESFAPAGGSAVTLPGDTAFLLELSEPGLVAASMVAVTGAKGSYVTGASPENAAGALWRVSLRALSDGAVSVTVPAAAITDRVGNVCKGKPARATVVVDSRGPFVTLTSAQARLSVTSADPLVVTASFSEPVTMSASDVVVTSGTVKGVVGRGPTTTFEVWGSDDGLLTVTLRPSLADPAGNRLAVAPTPLSFHVDRSPPTVKAVSSLADNASVDPLPVLVTMSEPVSMHAGSIAASSGTVSTPVAAGTPAGHDGSMSTAWLVDVAGVEAGALRVWVVDAVDGAGLALNNDAADGGEPVPELTVTVHHGAAGGFALMAETPVPVVGVSVISIVIRCSSPSIMTGASLSVSAGLVSGVLPSPPPAEGSSTYRFRLSELPEGLVTTTLVAASTPEGVEIDTTAVPPTVFRVDLTPPTVTVTSPGADASGATSASPVPIMLTFSEPVTVLPGAVAVSAGVLGVLLPVVVESDGTATAFTTQVSAVSDGPLLITVSATGVRDAGGHGMGADATAEFTVATIAPALVSLRVIDAVTHVPVAVDAEGMVVTQATTFMLEATYSAAVVISPADVSPSSGSVAEVSAVPAAGAATAATAANVWHVSLSSAAEGVLEVTLTAALPALASGAAGGSLAPDTRAVALVDLTAPTVTLVVLDDNTPSVLKLSATFSEPVTGFSAAGITVSQGTVSAPTPVATAAAGTAYTFTVSAPAATAAAAGEVTVQVAAGAGVDIVGWPSAASDVVTVVTADREPPTIVSASVVGGVDSFVPGDVMELWITFSEAVVVDEAVPVVVGAEGAQTVSSAGSVVKVQYRFHAADKAGRVAFRVVAADVEGNVGTFTSLPLTPPLFGCSPCEGGDLVHAVCVAFTDTVCRLAAPRLFPLRGTAPLDVRVATASAGRPGGAFVVVTSGGEQATCDMLPVAGTTWVFASAHDAKFTLADARDGSFSVAACPAAAPLSGPAEAMAFAAAVAATPAAAGVATLVAGVTEHVPGYAAATRVLVTPVGSDDALPTVTWAVPLSGLTAGDVTPTLYVELVEALASDVLIPGHRIKAAFDAPVALTSAADDGSTGSDGGSTASDDGGDVRRRLTEVEGSSDTGAAGDDSLVHVAAATRRSDATFVFVLEPLASEPGVEAEAVPSVLARVQATVGAAHLPGAVDDSAFVATLLAAGGSLVNGGIVTVDLRGAADEDGSGSDGANHDGLGEGEDGSPVTPPPPPGNAPSEGDGEAGQGAGSGASADPPLPTDMVLGAFAGLVFIALVVLAVWKARRNQAADRVVALHHTRSRVEWGPDQRIPKMVHRGYGFGSMSSYQFNDSRDPQRGRSSVTSPRSSRSKKRSSKGKRRSRSKQRVRRGAGRAQERDASSSDSQSPPPPPSMPAELDAPMQPVGMSNGASPVAGADEWDTRAEQRRELVKVNSWVSTNGEDTRAAEATASSSRNPAARFMGWLFGGKRTATPRPTALGAMPALQSAGRGNSFNSSGSGASSGTSDASSDYSDESDCDSVGDSKVAATPSGLKRSSSRPGSAATRRSRPGSASQRRGGDTTASSGDASPVPADDDDALDGSQLLLGLERDVGWAGGSEGLLQSLDADDKSFVNGAGAGLDSDSDFGSDSGGSSGGEVEERSVGGSITSRSRPGTAATSGSRGSRRDATTPRAAAPAGSGTARSASRSTSPQAGAMPGSPARPTTGQPGRRRSEGTGAAHTSGRRRVSKQSAQSAPARR